MRGITLFSLFNLALKHIVLLIIAAVVFAAGAFAYCEFVAEPRYSATGSILVTNGAVDIENTVDEDGNKKGLENTNVSASINFMDTACKMLQQNDIYKRLANELDNKYSYTSLKNSSKITSTDDYSLYIDVSFTASSREEAIKLVNTYLELTPDYVDSQVKSIEVKYHLCDTASKIYPQTVVTTALFAIVGAVFVYAILLVIFLMNTTIVNEDDFKERFDIDVIGAIPDFASARSGRSYKYYSKYNSYYGNYGYYGGYGGYGYYGRRGKKKDEQ